MSKKIFILNISSEPELVYTCDGIRISKQRMREIAEQYRGKVKFITKDLSNMKVLNPDSPRSKLENAILDVEVIEDSELEDIKDLISDFSL